ncbi:efflux transporter periplasmic adaptor subunit [Pseudoroseomonas deserti]|uniref:Efflux transporter periplasmic adaptor subunit n=1 Tax=Teichococcus deserti TaxID=1817963 RepID=A0A1V2GYU7_9PROT|nr:efflux RND transporter periplasmic adaptor subunit [Pseudoroseomonas deserti]ONG49503.1 efflux transporter periplasmic adaptor subunit [Pseudoroseomonas deserti]
MRYLKPILLALAVLGGGGGAILLLRPAAVTAAPDDPRRAAPVVRTALVEPASRVERGYTGVIAARVQSNLGFRVPGKVTERLVDTGQGVRAGQALMRLDPQDLSLALTSRQKAVDAARAQQVQAQADELRYRRLMADGWASRQRYEQVRATLDAARAQLAAAQAQAEVARNEAGYAVLVAEADGTVIETLAEPGQVVLAGQPVLRLAHGGAREAVVNLPETARPAIGAAAEASRFGGVPERSRAVLRQLSDAADPASRTYEARFVLDGDAALAPLGATVTLWLPPPGGDDAAMQVPLGALLDDGRRTGVWVVDTAASRVTLRPVSVQRLGQEHAVVTGVAAGERVVALGAHLLHAGQGVRTGLPGTATP